MGFKSVSIYVTANEDLLVLSRGISKKWGGFIMDLERHRFLERGFTDDMLETCVLEAFDDWNTIEPAEELKPTAIEKILHIKGYVKAVKHMSYICVEWDSDEGYKIIPTKNNGKKGFVHLENEAVNIGDTVRDGNLAHAIRTAIIKSK
jgi:hypothetical protein